MEQSRVEGRSTHIRLLYFVKIREKGKPIQYMMLKQLRKKKKKEELYYPTHKS